MPSDPSTTDSEVSAPELPAGAKSRFTDIWMKDFHVSPFNSRKGSYVLKALNPFPYATYDSPAIDNTITLISSKDHAKLVARLNSTGPAIHQNQLGVLNTARFILTWWWVGLVTFPRIVREAGKLFFKRSLHVWFRPEVLHTGVGRMPTSTEMSVIPSFWKLLLMLSVSSTKFSDTTYSRSSTNRLSHSASHSTQRLPMNRFRPSSLRISQDVTKR